MVVAVVVVFVVVVVVVVALFLFISSKCDAARLVTMGEKTVHASNKMDETRARRAKHHG